MKNLILAVCVCIVFAFIGNNVNAKEGAHHFPEIFIGATTFGSETEFSYALEYEYKFTDKWGAGLIYERTDKAHHGDGTRLKIAVLYYHPEPFLRFGLGIGKEKVGGYHPHEEDLVRLVASYDYHFEYFSVAPTVAVDFIDGENAYVVGLGFIKPF